jgi:immunity protein 53 of polymorphic toxin system
VTDPIAFLETWFLSQCDGDWEHDARIEISTLDNPGWYLSIDLTATDLEDLGLRELLCQS